MSLQQAYRDEHDGLLNAKADTRLHAGFDRLPRVAAGSTGENVSSLLAQVVAWAAAVNASHAAAFRINLGLLIIETLEDAGYAIPGLYRDGFCQATRGVDIPTVDHWCGRGGLPEFVRDFKYNEWEYRHQRSGSWESPDGGGIETPALDFLVGVDRLY